MLQYTHVGISSARLLLQYTAVPLGDGAPLRTVTVRDAIADLPHIQNGANEEEMQYTGASTLMCFHCLLKQHTQVCSRCRVA